MCGIVGIAGDTYSREEMTMKRLLLVDSLRGMDSTGIAAVRRGGQMVRTAKLASHPFNLFDTKTFSEALNATSSLAFIGHNRSATVGGIKDCNAHPFQKDHITGVHNGTLEDKDKKLLEEIAGEPFNTDSEALFAAIAKIGVKKVIPQITTGKDSLKGAWSLVWWDAKAGTLNFLRNDHRPLWYCYSSDFKLMFWASEFWMLDVALRKYGNYSLYEKASVKEKNKKFSFFQTTIDTLYTIDVEKLCKGGKEPPKPLVCKLAGKEAPVAEPVVPFNFRKESDGKQLGNGSSHPDLKTLINRSRTKATETSSNKNSSSDNVGAIHLLGTVCDPYGGYYDRMGFNQLGAAYSGKGEDPECNWCHGKVPYGQPGLTIFTRDNVLICGKCSGHADEFLSATADIAAPTRVYAPRASMMAYK